MKKLIWAVCVVLAVACNAAATERVLDYDIDENTWIESGDSTSHSDDNPLELGDGSWQVVFDYANETGVKDKEEINDLDPSRVYALWHIEDIDLDASDDMIAWEIDDGISWTDNWDWDDWSSGVGSLERGPTNIVLDFVLLGDANYDGVVNNADTNAVGTHWGFTSDVGWSEGDFNHDGVVNVTDMNIRGINSGKLPFVDKDPEVVVLHMNSWESGWGTGDDNGFMMELSGESSGEFVNLYSFAETDTELQPHFFVTYDEADPAPLPEPVPLLLLLVGGLGLMSMRRAC